MVRAFARQKFEREKFGAKNALFRDRYFREKDGLWRISDEVKKHVDFIHLNLLDRSKLALLGTMDVTLCRNVIIYFNTPTKQTVVASFEEKLRPGGYLLLGHSESLINISSAFELRHMKHDLGDSPYDPWHAAAAAAVARTDEGGAQ